MIKWGVIKNGWAILSEHTSKADAEEAMTTLQETSEPWIARLLTVESFEDNSSEQDA